MRCIVICPWTETIKEANHTGDYHDIYRLLSHGRHKVGTFTIAGGFMNGDVCYVDDNGLIAGLMLPCFKASWCRQPLAGRGVLIGSDTSGNSCDAKTPLALVKQTVSWTNLIAP